MKFIRNYYQEKNQLLLFIKNYSKVKEEIHITDEILTENIIDSDSINKYKNMNTDDLFDLLQENSYLLENPESIDINSLKKLSQIINIIDDKIHKETINIINNT